MRAMTSGARPMQQQSNSHHTAGCEPDLHAGSSQRAGISRCTTALSSLGSLSVAQVVARLTTSARTTRKHTSCPPNNLLLSLLLLLRPLPTSSLRYPPPQAVTFAPSKHCLPSPRPAAGTPNPGTRTAILPPSRPPPPVTCFFFEAAFEASSCATSTCDDHDLRLKRPPCPTPPTPHRARAPL